ncbi:MAG TPA: hypothetical protein VHZ77_01795 [Gaiellaceae bacterium]|nr:hypothetical protein [Gaiellaceae bacterium]
MRALLATAGLLVLAGSATAAAAKPSAAHTLRKSAGGPIEAVTQDNTTAAWLTAGTKPCNAVHLLSPGKPDRSLPQPTSSGMTCRWTLAAGQPQLAVAAGMSTALWTLHESGPSPLDFVVAASVGGPERQLDRLAHASDGAGRWLGGVAGAGRTLAYSWDDVEYVNPEKCLSNGGKYCKQKIADGGIQIVTRTDDTPLPGAEPALQLAAAAGRIAYIPATIVKAGRPSATTKASLPIVDADTGDILGQASVGGIPIAIALSAHVLAVLTTQGTAHDRISWFSTTDGTKLDSVLVSGRAAPQLAASDQLIVYRVGRLLRTVATANPHIGKLVTTGQNYVGLALAHGRLIWAENHNGSGRLRALAVG